MIRILGVIMIVLGWLILFREGNPTLTDLSGLVIIYVGVELLEHKKETK